MNKIKLVTVCFIIQDNDILIGKKRKDSFKRLSGNWHVPAGSEDNNDFAEADDFENLVKNVAKREMKEETNLDIGVEEIIDISYIAKLDAPKSTVVTWVHCENLKTSELKFGDDLEDVKWVKIEKLYNNISPNTVYSMPASVRVFLKSLVK
jgi:8-oxo-dGTP pyrophosphatase MutT (NUDIX family)